MRAPALLRVIRRGGRAVCVLLSRGLLLVSGDVSLLHRQRSGGVLVSLRGYVWRIEGDRITLVGRGSAPTPDPVHRIVSAIGAATDCFYGIGDNLLICRGWRCRCYPLKPIADIIERRLGVRCKYATERTRRRRGWVIAEAETGQKWWAECVPAPPPPGETDSPAED